MLGLFMLSLGTHIFNTHWLMHDIHVEQGRTTYTLPQVQQAEEPAKQAVVGMHGDVGKLPGSLSNTEHKLLHSADPAQPLLLTCLPESRAAISYRRISFSAAPDFVAPADPEPLFRPPISA